MKKVIIAALTVLVMLSGCAKQSAENSSLQSLPSAETEDKPSADTAYRSVREASSTASSVSDSSKGSSSAVSSKISSSSKTSSKEDKSSRPDGKKANSSVKIGDKNDPIRKVKPENVQQYVIQEVPIVFDEEPEAEYVNKYENIDPSRKVPDSWFDDCVFIGDSLSVGLSLYNDAYCVFGKGKFVCASSLSYSNCQWDLYRAGNVHPYYNGKKVLAEYAPSLTGSKKVVIGLGMNDIGLWGPEGTITYAKELIRKIRLHSPGVKIYLETVTPMIYGAQREHLNNDLIREFNSKLKTLAKDEGCGFLNSYDAFANSNGNLPFEFCSDPGALGIHLKQNACAVWTQFLKASIGTAYPGDEHFFDSDTQTDTDPAMSDMPTDNTDTDIDSEGEAHIDTDVASDTETEFDTNTDPVSTGDTETDNNTDTSEDEHSSESENENGSELSSDRQELSS